MLFVLCVFVVRGGRQALDLELPNSLEPTITWLSSSTLPERSKSLESSDITGFRWECLPQDRQQTLVSVQAYSVR